MLSVIINGSEELFPEECGLYCVSITKLRDSFNLSDGDVYLIRNGKEFHIPPWHRVYLEMFDEIVVRNDY